MNTRTIKIALALICIVSITLTSCHKKVTGVEIDTSGWVEGTSFYVGAHLGITAIVSPETAKDKSVTWISTNPSVASIDNTGYMVALSEGFTDMICKTRDGGFSDTLRIYVCEDYYPLIGRTYKGTLTVNDNQTINNVEINITTTTAVSHYYGIDFYLNGKYMSFGGNAVRENDGYRLIGASAGNPPYSDGNAVDATFDGQGNLNAVMVIASQPPMSLVYSGSKVE